MKYIDPEKIRNRIEAEMGEITYGVGEQKDIYQFCEELLSFITSLQQEQTPTEHEIAEAHRYAEMIREKDKARIQQEKPEVDLENYMEEYFKGWHVEEEIGLTKPDGWSCIVKDLQDIARHFWNKGYNARKEE